MKLLPQWSLQGSLHFDDHEKAFFLLDQEPNNSDIFNPVEQFHQMTQNPSKISRSVLQQ